MRPAAGQHRLPKLPRHRQRKRPPAAAAAATAVPAAITVETAPPCGGTGAAGFPHAAAVPAQPNAAARAAAVAPAAARQEAAAARAGSHRCSRCPRRPPGFRGRGRPLRHQPRRHGGQLHQLLPRWLPLPRQQHHSVQQLQQPVAAAWWDQQPGPEVPLPLQGGPPAPPARPPSPHPAIPLARWQAPRWEGLPPLQAAQAAAAAGRARLPRWLGAALPSAGAPA